MQDNMQTGPGPKGKGGPKAAGAGPQNIEMQIARMVVRAQWQQEWVAANPEGNLEDRKNAWKEARQGYMAENLKSARKLLVILKRQGVSMTVAATADAESDAESDVEASDSDA